MQYSKSENFKYLVIEASHGDYYGFNLKVKKEREIATKIVTEYDDFMVIGWKVAKKRPGWVLSADSWTSFFIGKDVDDIEVTQAKNSYKEVEGGHGKEDEDDEDINLEEIKRQVLSDAPTKAPETKVAVASIQEEPVAAETKAEPTENKVNVVGKIDLDAINQRTRPDKKKEKASRTKSVEDDSDEEPVAKPKGKGKKEDGSVSEAETQQELVHSTEEVPDWKRVTTVLNLDQSLFAPFDMGSINKVKSTPDNKAPS